MNWETVRHTSCMVTLIGKLQCAADLLRVVSLVDKLGCDSRNVTSIGLSFIKWHKIGFREDE